MKKILGLALILISGSAHAENGFAHRIDVHNSVISKAVSVEIVIDEKGIPFLHAEAPWVKIPFVEFENGDVIPNNAAAVRFFKDVSSGRVTAISNSPYYGGMCVQLEGDVLLATDSGGQEIYEHRVRKVFGQDYKSGQEVSLVGPNECLLY